jgi:hypothetical protein
VREATKERIELSQSPGYNRQAKTKVHGPCDKWKIEQDIEQRNEDVLYNAMTGDNEDGDFDDYESDGISARDCMGWE